jgi:hypothetical protein
MYRYLNIDNSSMSMDICEKMTKMSVLNKTPPYWAGLDKPGADSGYAWNPHVPGWNLPEPLFS